MDKVHPKGEKGQPVVSVRGLQRHSKKYLPSSSISYAKGVAGEYLGFGFHSFEAIGGVVFFGDIARGFVLVGFEVGGGTMAEKESGQECVGDVDNQQEDGVDLLGDGVKVAKIVKKVAEANAYMARKKRGKGRTPE